MYQEAVFKVAQASQS